MLHLFMAEGFEEIEALTTLDILRRCGLQVATVSITGTRLIRGAHGIPIMVDTVFRRGELESTQGIILPGGMLGTKNLSLHDGLRKLLIGQCAQQTLIAAICAAPTVLGKYNLLNGRRATCYPGIEDELKGAEIIEAMVVEDSNLITAKGPAASVEFAFAIAARFVDSSTIAQVRSSMLFN